MLYAVVPIAVVGFSAVTPSLQSLLSRHTAATQQGGMLGLGQSISALARILGPWVGLNLHGRNILWPYWAGAALMAFCVLLALGLRPPEDLPQDATSK
jgi:MFS family permease